MRFASRSVVWLLLGAAGIVVACGSKKDSNYHPNNPGFGGSAANSGAGGTSGTDGGGGDGGGANSSGTGGITNFGGGGSNCDGTKTPSEDACTIHEKYAVFVSPNGDDVYGDGSRAKPLKTFAGALGLAVSSNHARVYACATAGAFAEEVTLGSNEDGISLFGGFDCTTWDYVAGTKTKIDGPSSGALSIQDSTQGTLVEDFEISAKDATSPGAPSIGVVIGNSQNVELQRVKVSAGTGAAGLAGYATPGVAASGKPGSKGKAQCGFDFSGGAAVTSGCGGLDSVGGKGGGGGFGFVKPGDGSDGEPANGAGAGGIAQDDTLPGGWSCAMNGKGANGKAGDPGTHGKGGSTPGQLTSTGWLTDSGQFGTNGGEGQGGGGGGGAKPPASCTGMTNPTGASGGSGGSGGCGGIGGEGGQGGGASIALASYQSSVTLVDVDSIAKGGGKGGAGGKGQLAGKGQLGAAGGTGACAGGNGADGGNGGHGGGGAGGPSIGMAYQGAKPSVTGGSVAIASTASAGGADGLGATTGAGAGVAGVLEKEHAF